MHLQTLAVVTVIALALAATAPTASAQDPTGFGSPQPVGPGTPGTSTYQPPPPQPTYQPQPQPQPPPPQYQPPPGYRLVYEGPPTQPVPATAPMFSGSIIDVCGTFAPFFNEKRAYDAGGVTISPGSRFGMQSAFSPALDLGLIESTGTGNVGYLTIEPLGLFFLSPFALDELNRPALEGYYGLRFGLSFFFDGDGVRLYLPVEMQAGVRAYFGDMFAFFGGVLGFYGGIGSTFAPPPSSLGRVGLQLGFGIRLS
ncbi:MAG: hypothetical protein AB7K09_07850 [Planctomycetota bacterium]